jgi:hypothetical protein
LLHLTLLEPDEAFEIIAIRPTDQIVAEGAVSSLDEPELDGETRRALLAFEVRTWSAIRQRVSEQFVVIAPQPDVDIEPGDVVSFEGFVAYVDQPPGATKLRLDFMADGVRKRRVVRAPDAEM